MATNKFATMLHKSTHKLTLILVYAVLEWILITLLLLNSLFNYLITKFANYFGLKPPCPWCSRIDHVLDCRANTINSRSKVVCETHATEISKLSYCANHRKLAESRTMCVNCLDSRPDRDDESVGIRRIAFLSWVENAGVENCEEIPKCSCCDERLSNDFCPPCLLFKPSWDSFKFNEKGSLVIEAIDDTENDGIDCKEVVCKNDCLVHLEEDKEAISTDCFLPYAEESKANETDGKEEQREENGGAVEHQVLSDDGNCGINEAACMAFLGAEPELFSEETEANASEEVVCGVDVHHDAVDDLVSHHFREEDRSLENIILHLKSSVDSEINRVIPVELIDLSMIEHGRSSDFMEFQSEEDHCDGAADSTKGEGRQVDNFEEAAITEDNQEELPELGLEDTKVDAVEEYSKDEISLVEVQTSALAALTKGNQEELPVLGLEDTKLDAVDEELKEETSPEEVQTVLAAVTKGNQEELPLLGLEDTKLDAVEEELKEETSPERVQTSALAAEIDEASDAKNELDLPAQEPETDDCKSFVDEVRSETIAGSSQESTPSLTCLQQDRPLPTTEADETFNGIKMSEACFGHDLNDSGKASVEQRTIAFEKSQDEINHQQSSETNEAEEKLPETPTSLDSLQSLNKKSVVIEKRETGAEESLDGSVISEMDSADPILTIERLRDELNAERKALRDLYAELEEERSASAIAANQTMAMINRLQEEKASMQMEALQYQRMMEEQSEYDQEALQLLNELMIKREKEKQELEKELEASRKKIIEYEEKEKMRIIRRIKDGSVRSRNSSATCSNVDDIDTIPVDLDHEARDENGSIVNGNGVASDINIPDDDEAINLEEIALDCVKQMSALDGSLAEFEEERLSILDQLKALEEKLLTMSDNELIEDINLTGCFSTYNAAESADVNEFGAPDANGSSELPKDRLYHQRLSMASMAKNLLPLLDAASTETEEGFSHEQITDSGFVETGSSSAAMFELDNKRASIEEEVDHVYERLQALEADKEFLKHCMSSINNGDKGMDLLQEILQHLRDLKAVELRVRNMSDSPVS